MRKIPASSSKNPESAIPMKNRFLFLLFLLLPLRLAADEGMWMVNALSRALVQNMENEGLKLGPREIYSEDAVSLKDALVSLDFGCTGSMVSPEGLLITNHHCAYGDVHSLSTPEHNYLEEGFWAQTREAEIPIPGKRVYFLKKVLDVTEELEALKEELTAEGKPFGSRKLSHIMETRYSRQTGWEASLSSMWAGSKYYMALYEVFTDVRLVAAPPVSIAAFGGDEDNWEWPQHKCDFALYRVYTGRDGKPAGYCADNVPMVPVRFLTVSTRGISEGDFAMVMGYPGRTDRYASSAKVRHLTGVTLPVCNEARAAQMEIIRRHMDADPAVRLKYSDRFFSLSNVQELQEGEVECCRRYCVEEAKKALEADVPWQSDLVARLDAGYSAIAGAERNKVWYRETLIRGTRLALVATRLNSLKRGKSSPEREAQVLSTIKNDYDEMDLRVEKDLLRYALEAYYENVDCSCWGPFQKELKARFGTDYDALCEALWVSREMTAEDDLCRFFGDVNISSFNSASDALQGDNPVVELGREYTRTLYRWREVSGIPQYPDANSTMRLTYGTVKGYSPRDGITGRWQTFTNGILEKEDGTKYDFRLFPDWKASLAALKNPIPVDFLTDNDITGGNSGSPVMNADGELIGLAFDGNKESLASDFLFTPDYNRCVCVDIRFVLWTLEHYGGMKAVLSEMQID